MHLLGVQGIYVRVWKISYMYPLVGVKDSWPFLNDDIVIDEDLWLTLYNTPVLYSICMKLPYAVRVGL